jgi:hypothetical protein
MQSEEDDRMAKDLYYSNAAGEIIENIMLHRRWSSFALQMAEKVPSTKPKEKSWHHWLIAIVRRFSKRS